MTTDVRDHLCRLQGPWLLGVIHLCQINLGVGNSTGNSEFQALLIVSKTSKESRLFVIGEGTAKGIANLIGEGCDTWHLVDVGFHAELILRIGTSACAPSLSINKYGGVDAVNHLANLIHRLNVVYPHEVKTETVNMVFINPIFD